MQAPPGAWGHGDSDFVEPTMLYETKLLRLPKAMDRRGFDGAALREAMCGFFAGMSEEPVEVLPPSAFDPDALVEALNAAAGAMADAPEALHIACFAESLGHHLRRWRDLHARHRARLKLIAFGERSIALVVLNDFGLEPEPPPR
ncbi:MAG: hypothetical protein H6740_04120 [Alphaproteobacteria bacterium]|nr:hypothetical protein [Alphaproteobacteria bacterium]